MFRTWSNRGLGQLVALVLAAPALAQAPAKSMRQFTDSVYPNPALNWELRDLTGNLLAQGSEPSAPELQIDVSQMPPATIR